MSTKLSLLDNSSDSEGELKINKNYAEKYDVWRNKEELQKYKDLKKEDNESSSSSESEEEIPEFDEEFFRALSLLKGRDPRIYDKNFELFKNKEVVKKPRVMKQKPIYMKDYERNLVLEKGGQFSDEDDDQLAPITKSAYDEEQENLRKSFKEAVGDSDSDDDLLKVRTKTEKEEEAEEEDYLKWLKGEKKEVSEDVRKDMSYLRNYWNDPKLDDGEKFLRDYILNKQYLEQDDSEIPTYEEITRDEEIIAEQEKFEHKYNFRFEEPDEEFIKRYPRTIGDSLRKTDTRRKQKREEKAERKKREKELRKEELKRLKALKRKEIEEKFLKLKEVSGQEEINLNESDIEGDFDPDKHDQKMHEMFSEDYYKAEEDQKPEFPYDEELDSENWNTWTREENIVEDCDEKADDSETRVCENSDLNDHGEVDINPKEKFANEMIEACNRKKKLRKKSLFAKIISQPKPVFDPEGKSFEEYLDEYYKLDYEDIVGDMPVRYRYRKVIPNDFGLTVDEIMAAHDRELNRWCSVKKTCQYRNDDEEMYDIKAYRNKAHNFFTKKKVLASVYAQEDADNNTTESSNVKKKFVDEDVDSTGVCVNDDDDTLKNGGESTVEQKSNSNEDSSTQWIKKDKKRKKVKEKRDTSPVANASESYSTSKGYINNIVESSNLLSDTSESTEQKISGDSLIQFKEKRKKHKDRENTSKETNLSTANKFVVINSDLNTSILESSSLENNFQKSSKRKRNFVGEHFTPNTETDFKKKKDDNVVSNKVSPSSSHNHLSSLSDKKTVCKSTCEAPTTKKKKKKKKKQKHNKKEILNDNAANCMQQNKSEAHDNRNKKRNVNISEDKRLGLSDERLAAYGINPKKFKNRIIYSQK